jgi:hypothetical protein
MQTSDIAANAFLNILSNARWRVAKEVDNLFRLANVAHEDLRRVIKELCWNNLHVFLISGLGRSKSGNGLADLYQEWRTRYGPCTREADIRSVLSALKKAQPHEVRELVERQLFKRNGNQDPVQMILVTPDEGRKETTERKRKASTLQTSR